MIFVVSFGLHFRIYASKDILVLAIFAINFITFLIKE